MDALAELHLPPGFRFHPTDDELVLHYLCRKAAGLPLPAAAIAEVDIYKLDPWDLPEKALFGDREWYFFTPRDKKYPNGSRPNRAAGGGFWKATGADKPVSPGGRTVGIKKALVFYSGKSPRGIKTDWIMHEYRLPDAGSRVASGGGRRLDDWVLCRLYHKKNAYRKKQGSGEAAAAAECGVAHRSPLSEVDNGDSSSGGFFPEPPGFGDVMEVKKEEESIWPADLIDLDGMQSAFSGEFESMAAELVDDDYYLLPMQHSFF